MDGCSSKPKQLKFPSQVYIDLPLWREDQLALSPGSGPCGPRGEEPTAAPGGLGSPEGPEDSCNTTATTSASSTSTTPQLTPTNSLKRPSARRRTDSVLYSCGAMLASLALGYDLREALQSPEEGPGEPPREEKKKKLFHRATRFRRSTSPPGGRAPRKEEPASGHSPGNALGPVNLISMSAILECNSNKCLLQTGGGGLADRKDRTPDTAAGVEGPQDKAAARTQPMVQTPSPAPETGNPIPGLRLRRKKSSSTNHSSE